MWTIRLLFLALAVTPLRQAWRWPQLILLRRMIGVAAFCYVVAHVSGYVVDQAFDLTKVFSEIVSRIYLTIGAVAVLGLAALAATSTDAMIRRIGGRNWRRLHQAGYGIAMLATIHFFMQSKLFVGEATVMGGLYLWLMGYRLLAWLGPVPTWRLAGLSLVAMRSHRLWRGRLFQPHPRRRSRPRAGPVLHRHRPPPGRLRAGDYVGCHPGGAAANAVVAGRSAGAADLSRIWLDQPAALPLA